MTKGDIELIEEFLTFVNDHCIVERDEMMSTYGNLYMNVQNILSQVTPQPDWVKISESGLPTKEGKYSCWSIYGTRLDAEYFIFHDKQSRENHEKFWRDHYSHWLEREETKPPLY